jgi:hypothetical protein
MWRVRPPRGEKSIIRRITTRPQRPLRHLMAFGNLGLEFLYGMFEKGG